MKRLLFSAIACMAAVILSGCSSELDKCISSNEAKVERMSALELQNLDGFPHVLEADIREAVTKMQAWYETQAAKGWAKITDEDIDEINGALEESFQKIVPVIGSTFSKDWYPTLPDSVAEWCDEKPSFCYIDAVTFGITFEELTAEYGENSEEWPPGEEMKRAIGRYLSVFDVFFAAAESAKTSAPEAVCNAQGIY